MDVCTYQLLPTFGLTYFSHWREGELRKRMWNNMPRNKGVLGLINQRKPTLWLPLSTLITKTEETFRRNKSNKRFIYLSKKTTRVGSREHWMNKVPLNHRQMMLEKKEAGTPSGPGVLSPINLKESRFIFLAKKGWSSCIFFFFCGKLVY